MDVQVREYGLSAALGDGLAGSHKGQGLGGHQITLLNADQFQGDLGRSRTIYICDSMRTASIGDHVALEAVGLGTYAKDECGADCVDDVLPLSTRKDQGMQQNEV